MHATGNVDMGAARETSSLDDYTQSTSKGLLSSTTNTHHVVRSSDTAATTSITGKLVAITADGNITGEGVRLSGDEGVLVHAQGRLDLHEARDFHSESTQSTTKKSGFAGSIGGIPVPLGAGSRDTVTSSSDTAVATTIQSARGGVLLQAEGAAVLRGVKVDAAGDIKVRGDTVSVTAATDYTSSSSEHYRRGTNIDASLWHDPGKGIDAKNTDTASEQSTSLVRSTFDGANVSIKATGQGGTVAGESGVLDISGTTVHTSGALSFEADRLILGTQTTQTDTSQSSQGGDAAWIKNKGEGKSDQTTNYNEFNAGSIVRNVGSVQVGLGAKDSIGALAQQPGMAWIGDIANDPKLAGKVDWVKVEEAHQSWNYNQQGLTPAAAAVVTLVVAYFSAGTGAEWGAAAGESAAVAAGQGAIIEGAAFTAGSSVGAVVGGAVTAGISALAGQAAVTLINNRGDLNATLHDLGSSASVRNLLTAIATGGVLGGMNLNPTGLPTNGGGAQGLLTQLGQNLQAGAAKAVIDTAINGGSLEAALGRSIRTALIDTAAAQAANAIGNLSTGDAAVLDAFGNKVAHAIAGCLTGAARTDTSGGCSAGAIGAVVGEIAAEAYGRQSDTTQFAAMMGAIAAAATGASAAEVNLAGQAAGNAAANNYLSHPEAERLSQLAEACKAKCTPSQREQLAELLTRDGATTAALNACAGVQTDACRATRADYATAAASFLPTDLDIWNWSRNQEQASNGTYTAAQIYDAYRTSFIAGAEPLMTSTGDLTQVADWMRGRIVGDGTAANPGEGPLSVIAMGWAVGNSASAQGALASGILTLAGTIRGIASIAPRATTFTSSIDFGRVENQISHTFRHIDAAGLDRQAVQLAIERDLTAVSSTLPLGLYTGMVTVDGVLLRYNAFRFPDGNINVGRITPP